MTGGRIKNPTKLCASTHHTEATYQVSGLYLLRFKSFMSYMGKIANFYVQKGGDNCASTHHKEAIYQVSGLYLLRFKSFTSYKVCDGRTEGRTEGRTDGRTRVTLNSPSTIVVGHNNYFLPGMQRVNTLGITCQPKGRVALILSAVYRDSQCIY